MSHKPLSRCAATAFDSNRLVTDGVSESYRDREIHAHGGYVWKIAELEDKLGIISY